MSPRSTRRIPTVLALALLAAMPAYGGHGGGHGGGGHTGGGGHHAGGGPRPAGTHSGVHGRGSLASNRGSTAAVPWNQPVLQPDQLPEAKLARFVHHLFHP